MDVDLTGLTKTDPTPQTLALYEELVALALYEELVALIEKHIPMMPAFELIATIGQIAGAISVSVQPIEQRARMREVLIKNMDKMILDGAS